MRLKGIIIALLAGLSILGGCAEESCPVAANKPEYYFRKKAKIKYKTKRKPTPSLIHISRVTYRPGSNR